MRRFDNTELWQAIKSANNISFGSSAGLDAILDAFVSELHTYCRNESNIAERTRSLNYARNELVALIESQLYESRKNTPIRKLIKRTIHFIDCEIEITKMELEYPERFIEFPSDTPPLARWGGNIVDLIEYTIGPQAAGVLQKPSGKPMNYEESVEFLEKVFSITISNPHDRRSKVLERQKNTSFQDEMRRVFLEEVKKRYK